jgi:23S rRNA (adenine-N6)-dimethyltransferase
MDEQLWHSQNFVRDPDLIKKLLKKTDITSSDTVLDIGAGDGTITKELAAKAKKIISIELDPQSVENLRILSERKSNIEVVNQDFFTYPLPSTKYKVFSNPPFNRISDIVRTFLDAKNPPSTMYLFMQWEAAERFIGEPLGKMTQIAAIYNSLFKIEIVSKVHRSEFVPMPNVDVVFAQFTRRTKPLIEAEQIPVYRDFVTYLFNQWQPTVLDSLKRVFTHEQRKRIVKELRIDNLRPSELTFKQLYSLFEVFMKYVPKETKKVVEGTFQKLKGEQKNIQKTHRSLV